jgi:hypothetical protein
VPLAPPPTQTTDTDVTPAGTVHVPAPLPEKITSFEFIDVFVGYLLAEATILTAPEPPIVPE